MASDPAKAAHVARVLVADSSRIYTQVISDALKRDPGLKVIDWDGVTADLVAAVVNQRVDVFAISCTMDARELRGLELVRELQAARPAARAVVLLDSQDRDTVVEAFRAGARGVFSREGSVESFCKCIHCVHQGQIWASTREVEFVVEALAATPNVMAGDAKALSVLSKREAEVVRYLAQGFTNREIAERMNLSQHTIKNYLFRVFDKLGVSSRVELLFLALSQTGNPADAAPQKRSEFGT
jgi:two-component system nitrate/nitrite response regulator NarL